MANLKWKRSGGRERGGGRWGPVERESETGREGYGFHGGGQGINNDSAESGEGRDSGCSRSQKTTIII